MTVYFTVDDLTIEVWMAKMRTEIGAWEIGFWSNDDGEWSYRLTQRHESIKTIAGVIDAIKLFIKRKNPAVFKFDAIGKKTQLYKTIVNKINLQNYKVEIVKTKFDTEFKFTRT